MKKGLIKKVVASALLGIMTMGFVGCGASNNKSATGTKDLLETIQENGKVVVGMSADYAPYEFHYIETIQENGKVVVGMSADYAPYEFHYIDENGKDVIGGFDVDIANEIANAIGVELVIQEMDFDALVAALPAGKIDLVVSGMNPTEERAKVVDFSEIYYNSQHGILVRSEDVDKYKTFADLEDLVVSGMNPTEERAKVVDFSEIYYNSQHGILVRSEDVDKYKTFADLEGAKVGAQLGSTQEQIARSEVPNADLQLLNNVNNLILELKAGKVDAVIMEKPVAEMAVKSNPELAVGTPIYEDKTGGNAVGMAKNNPELLAKINEVIKELNETGKMDEYIVKANELAGSVNIVE